MDGEEFSGGSATGATLEIGSDSFIDGFEDGLIGAKVGDTVTLNLTFPDPYENNEDYSGKDVTFEVTINKIIANEPSEPEYTDDWINEYTSGTYTNKTEFEAYVVSVLEQQEATQEENQILTSLQSQIYTNCTVSSLPDGLLDQYVQQQKEYDEAAAEQQGYTLEGYISAYYNSYYGLDMETEEDYIEYFTSYYQESLEKMLIREAIIATEGYEVTEEATQKFFEDYAAAYGYSDPESFLAAYYGVTSIEDFIEQTGEEQVNKSVLTNIMWDDLIASADVTYVEEDASGDATASGDAE
jgi:trigger factor